METHADAQRPRQVYRSDHDLEWLTAKLYAYMNSGCSSCLHNSSPLGLGPFARYPKMTIPEATLVIMIGTRALDRTSQETFSF